MSRVSGGSRILTIRAKYLGESQSGLAFKASLYREKEGEEEHIAATLWCAHSVVRDGAGKKVEAEYENEITLLIPLWLLEKANIDTFYKEQLMEAEYGGGEEELPEDFDDWS